MRKAAKERREEFVRPLADAWLLAPKAAAAAAEHAMSLKLEAFVLVRAAAAPVPFVLVRPWAMVVVVEFVIGLKPE